ncbi:MAG: T9SS type A sorting domain-containing protein [Bacteroidota bacterium]|jgi:hypothetical protein
MKPCGFLFVLVLTFAFVGMVQAQTVSPHDYAPKSAPTGVVVQGNEAEVNIPAAPESMSKAAATLDIPPVVIIPTIDGVISPGEWSDAVQLTPAAVTGTNNVAWMKIDACYLHVGAIINSTLYGNGDATMLNIWFDLDRDGTWDLTGNLDGNLALPSPSYGYPPNVASFGHPGLGGDWALSGGRLRYMRPWMSLGTVVPASQIIVRRTFPVAGVCNIEASIDYRTSPLRLTGGTPFNMRVHWYHGDHPGYGAVTIMAQWPTLNTSAYFTGPLPSELVDVLPAAVAAPPDVFDVNSMDVQDNPSFNSKAFNNGDNMNVEIQYVSTAPPTTSPYVINFYGPHPSSALYATYSGVVHATQPSGSAIIAIPVNLPIGFYRVEVIVDDPWLCGVFKITDYANILVLRAGDIPCTVWSGDVNTDGVVNYGDRASLNQYIYDANLDPFWLFGPGRLAPHYPDLLAEFEWTGQAAAPWYTPEGCHMDADGNGNVNNFDYIAIKLNWLKNTGSVGPKDGRANLPMYFNMGQNYPNPFNPSTTLQVNLPERSNVRIVVVNALGRIVATLLDTEMNAGSHSTTFNADGLATGTYLATAVMTGLESGIVYRQTVTMSLLK